MYEDVVEQIRTKNVFKFSSFFLRIDKSPLEKQLHFIPFTVHLHGVLGAPTSLCGLSVRKKTTRIIFEEMKRKKHLNFIVWNIHRTATQIILSIYHHYLM